MEYTDVIEFWFEQIEPKQWWIKDPEFDSLIINSFAEVHDRAIKGELVTWRITPEGRLAEIIVLDQFSRNMFRGNAKSFEYDCLALVLAQEAISLGADKKINDKQRPFMYLPFMHSESLQIHDVAIRLYTDNGSKSELDFEIKHRDIIQTFGRYPHRNEILGRLSTEEEIEFLSRPGSGF